MNRIQGSRIIGHVTLFVKGDKPERFFEFCVKKGIPVWNIKKQRTDLCIGTIYWHHLNQVKRHSEQLPYQLTITKPKGLAYKGLRLWHKREIILAILLCVGLVFVLSNIVWKLEVTGVTKEIDQKIREELKAYGLYKGAWVYNLEALDQIQHDLLHEIPDLLYIGIHKKGTTYHIDAVEKLIEKEEKPLPLQHLVASKAGVIQNVFIKNGVANIGVHDVVQKGDLLVSGMIKVKEEEGGEGKEEEEEPILVAAEGKVYANTWYEVSVTSTLYPQMEKLTGKQSTKYALQVKGFAIPIWGFKDRDFGEVFIDTEQLKGNIFGYELPITVKKTTIYDKAAFTHIRTYEEAKQIAINHVMNDLTLQLGKDAEVLNYKVLHEAQDNGKVKLNLYISVLENIAKGKAIK